MEWKTIEKPRDGWAVTPNLVDYDQARTTFSWEAVRDFTYGDLYRLTNRFANVLNRLGVRKGERHHQHHR
jgi:acyl-coenzyme A synthetase/AMP-(fatty) acid ligase